MQSTKPFSKFGKHKKNTNKYSKDTRHTKPNYKRKSEPTLKPLQKKRAKQNYKYLCILDFEANADVNGPSYPQEITEFPIVLYNTETDKIEMDTAFHHYCQCHTHPITKYATDLTGITQQMVDDGSPFHQVMDDLETWMLQHDLIDPETYQSKTLFITVGNWDLLTALPNYCKYLGINIPIYLQEWCNVKVSFQEHYNRKSGGMMAMLRQLGIQHTGRHHSGISDCENTANIVQRLVNDGHVFQPNGSLFYKSSKKFQKTNRNSRPKWKPKKTFTDGKPPTEDDFPSL